MHVLTKAGVAIASLDKYHPALKPHIETIKAMGKAAEDRMGLTWADLSMQDVWAHSLSEVVTEHGGTDTAYYRPELRLSSGVYSIPFLNPDYCDALLTEVAAMSFAVNPDETAEVQIPEITLADNCPALHSCLHGLFNNVVNPLTKVLYQLEQAKMSAIQFAQ